MSGYDALVEYFADGGWTYAADDEGRFVRLAYTGDNGTWPCFAKALEAQERLVFYSLPEAPAPEERRAAVAEFMTRANYGLVIGNFEMDLSDGEIRFKTSVDYEGVGLSRELIDRVVAANVTAMDAFLPGLVAVRDNGVSAQEAIGLVDQG